VIAIDTIEHFHPDEFDATMDRLAACLRPGGVLFAHNYWSQANGSFPMHFDHSERWQAFVERHSLRQQGELEWVKP